MQSNNKSVMLSNLRVLEFVAAKLGEVWGDAAEEFLVSGIKFFFPVKLGKY